MNISKRHNRVIKKILLIVIWLVLILAITKTYSAWKYEQENPQTSYTYNSYEDIPQELMIKIRMHTNIRDLLLFNVLLVILIQILDYMYEPNGHYFESISNFFIKINRGKEDENNGKGRIN